MATSAPLWSPPPLSPPRGNSKTVVNSKVMVVAVAVLFAVVLFILCLHLYAKWFWRHQATRATRDGQIIHRLRAGAYVHDPPVDAAHSVGLERALVEALPTFEFSGENKFECAVCLEDFEAGEKGRTLPLCGHAFHLDCIDMWLHSHSTCPLCRASLTNPKALPPQEATIVGAPFMAAMRASRRRQRSVSSLNSLPRTDEAENPGTETDTGTTETTRLPQNLKEYETSSAPTAESPRPETGLAQDSKEFETSSAATAEESRPGIRAPFQVTIDIPRSGGFGGSNNPASVMSPMARASASFRRLLSRGKSVVTPQSDEGGPSSSPPPPSPAGAAAIV